MKFLKEMNIVIPYCQVFIKFAEIKNKHCNFVLCENEERNLRFFEKFRQSYNFFWTFPRLFIWISIYF
jgi:hypothetical protein